VRFCGDRPLRLPHPLVSVPPPSTQAEFTEHRLLELFSLRIYGNG
jgi:hypothetical protein